MSSPHRAFGDLVRFFLVALGATTVLHGSLVVFGLGFSLAPTDPAFYLYVAGLAMPSLAAILLSEAGTRRAFLRSVLALRGPMQVHVVAVLAQGGLILLAWLLLLASGTQSRPSPSLASGFALLALGQIWVVFGEELGWRGFALPRLESLLSPRWATLVLALGWGVWHTPMFFVADSLQAQSSPWLFAASIFAWSAIHTALYQRSKPSVLPNLVFHASANITLNVGLVPASLEPCLLASYLIAGIVVWATLPRRRSGVTAIPDGPP